MPERRAGLRRAIIGRTAVIVGFAATGVGLWGIDQSINEKSILVKDYPALYEVNSAQHQIMQSEIYQDANLRSAGGITTTLLV